MGKVQNRDNRQAIYNMLNAVSQERCHGSNHDYCKVSCPYCSVMEEGGDCLSCLQADALHNAGFIHRSRLDVVMLQNNHAWELLQASEQRERVLANALMLALADLVEYGAGSNEPLEGLFDGYLARAGERLGIE